VSTTWGKASRSLDTLDAALSDGVHLQAELRARITVRDRLLTSHGVPVMSRFSTPICFVAVGRTSVAYRLVERLLAMGFFTNPAVFPAVSVKRAGIRFTVTRHHTPEDIRALVAAIAHALPEALAAEGSNLEEVYRIFSLPQSRPAAA
jgi:7-keto-8-aminopelargonate synthetase-like enzyme